MKKFVELCRVGERKLDEIQKKKQASITEEQEIKEKTQKLRMKITQLQEQQMAFGMQWEKREASLIQSIEEINR
jgi:FtsZ-binding cell division protein ZapB